MSEDDFDGAQPQPLRPQTATEAVIAENSKRAVPPAFTQAELLAWRTYMRANPPTPEPKALHRRATQWEEPTEWMRRDGAEQ